MAKYTVQGTDLKHKKVLYPEGSTIELTKEEAAAVANWITPVEPVKASKEAQGSEQTETDSTGSEQAAGESADTDSSAVEPPAGDVPSGEPTKNKKEK